MCIMCGTLYIFFIVIALQHCDCYFDVEMTGGKGISGKNNEMNIDGLKVKKFNKTMYGASGIIEINVQLDNTYELRSNLYKKQGNEYKLTPFHIGPYKFCDYISEHSLLYDEVMRCSNVPERTTCPYPNGTFKLDKCTIPLETVPKYFDGEYRVDITLSRNDEVVGGYQIFFYVISFGG